MSELNTIRERLVKLRARRAEIAQAAKSCSAARFEQLEREAAEINRQIEAAEAAFDGAAERAQPREVRLFDAKARGVGAWAAEERRQAEEAQAARERSIARSLERRGA